MDLVYFGTTVGFPCTRTISIRLIVGINRPPIQQPTATTPPVVPEREVAAVLAAVLLI